MMSIDHFASITHRDSVEPSRAKRIFEPYAVRSFTEAQDPMGALEAQRLQGESYVDFRIADASVLDELGRLPDWLDHARGEDVTYFAATSMGGDMKGWASGRLIDRDLESLPVYEGCRDVIDPSHRDFLRGAVSDGRRVREVGAMALSSAASSIASFSIIRDIVQSAIQGGTQEILTGRQTPVALKGFRAMFGGMSVRQMGESAILDAGGGLAVELTPVYADTHGSLDNLLYEIKHPGTEARVKERLTRSLLFLVDGLYAEDISTPVKGFLGEMGLQPESRHGG